VGFGSPKGARDAAIALMREQKARRQQITGISARSGYGAVPAAAPTPLAWKFIGPQPMMNERANFGGVEIGPPISSVTGRVTAVAVDPKTTGLIYVGTANGGLWRSTDGGDSFVSIGPG